ncbi:hypothetical protein [Mucilaginibacter sp.]|uniref:hypothetical protein n=1 Tax=Mucilaginibacter sp. TaxID=1882438 RepID=UPI0026345FAE|nr:hypothetical protein [Mucilaginibacter sp.]MDB4922222.1 hypothetical protein [Mucilaginibacter sp.]
MVKILLTFVFLFEGLFCSGQTFNQLNKDTANYKNTPVFVLNTGNKQLNIQTRHPVIDQNDLSAVNVYQKSETTNLILNDDRSGTIYFTFKPGITLIDLPHLLKKFDIAIKGSMLPVFIDSVFDYQPKTMYFQLSAVKSVKIEEEANTRMKYISIISVNPPLKLKQDEIYLH